MKKLLALILVVAALLCVVGCESAQNGSNSSVLTEIESNEAPAESKPDLAKNPITGEYTLSKDAVNRRPVGVMINNIKASLPQRGISKADMYYEVLAEGGITRILTLFSDVNAIPDLGSLRSARYYFLALAQGHNAVFCHFGGEKYALNLIKERGIKTINFMQTSASYRDKNRVGKYAYEHTAFTDGARLAKAINSKKINMDAKISDAFKFGDSSKSMKDAVVANTITAPFSSYNTATFTYDSESGLYTKNQFGAPQIDDANKSPIAVKNVFVLKTTTGKKYDNSKNGYIDVDLSQGNGYYACNGKIVPISWKKGADQNPLKYYTLDGKELTVSTGKSYVCIIPITETVSYN